MNKTSIFLFVLWISIVLMGCSKRDQFVVTGKITHAEHQMIYLDELHVGRATTVVDSTRINRNAEFELRGHTDLPAFYLLRLSEKKFITLLIDSTEVVTVNADEANFAYSYKVEGSPGSILVNELNSKLSNTLQRLDSLSSLNETYKGRSDYARLKAQVELSYKQIMDNQVKFSTDFVKNHPFSMASVFALYQKFDSDHYVVNDLQSFKVVASALNSIYPKSEHVKALYANTLEQVKRENSAKLRKLIEDKGTNSPDIVLPDKDGNKIALSSLRGKFVLLQFWSAKDRGSRIVNGALVELYKQFRNKGFDIYQVSVDNDRDAWIKAIKEDKLTWINVGDMEGSLAAVHTYNIQEIPYNYLLDKEGVIVAKGLKGPELYDIVKEYLD